MLVAVVVVLVFAVLVVVVAVRSAVVLVEDAVVVPEGVLDAVVPVEELVVAIAGLRLVAGGGLVETVPSGFPTMTERVAVARLPALSRVTYERM